MYEYVQYTGYSNSDDILCSGRWNREMRCTINTFRCARIWFRKNISSKDVQIIGSRSPGAAWC